MGKKGSWFSIIKRVFTPHSKEKLANDSDKTGTKEKKKKGGKLKYGEKSSFIPLFREPSSIEKIFGDFEREQQSLTFRPHTPPEQPKTPPFVPRRVASPRASSPRVVTPKAASPPRAVSPKVASPPRAPSPRIASPCVPSPRVPSPVASASRNFHQQKQFMYRPEPTIRNHHDSATRIQTAYRGYMARRSFRALKGLVRLQGVVRGQNVKRQTANAMKYMQLLVRVQSQVQFRRIQMLENQARHQTQFKSDKEVETNFGKWSQASEAGNNDESWDDSLLTKEEREERMQKKIEAIIKRERAMAYAYSHQLGKGTPKSGQTQADIRTAGFPWWWNWLERQLPSENPAESNALKNFRLTPPRSYSELKQSPRLESSNQKQHHYGFDYMDTPTPRSSKSTMLTNSKLARTPPPSRTQQGNNSGLSRYSRARGSGAESPFNVPLQDDDSLTSCPPFSVPSYMASTASAKAKARASSNPRERFLGTPSSESKRRFSFPLTPGIGSFKWNKGDLFSNKDTSSPMILEKKQSLQSIENLSVDSTVSMPAGVGRKKPFNRFV